MKKNHACFILAPFNDSHEKGKVKIWISKEDKIPIIIEQHGKSGKITLNLQEKYYNIVRGKEEKYYKWLSFIN